jgi:DNA-binding PadR family transcriptional regulator
MENKNYYAIIPAPVRYCKYLKANEKLMYGELTALSNDKGFCFASNEYFSNLYDVSKTSISKWISNLEKNGFIKIKMIYEPGTKQIKQRRIYIAPLLKKTSIPIEEKLNTPIEEKLKDIYILTNNNNINNNNSTKSKKRQYSEKTTKAFSHFVALFPLKYRPKTDAQKNKWLDCLDKIERLDGYNLREVYNVAKELRNDEFWQNNFLSILKLRNTDKNGIKYIDRFMVQHKAKQKPVGFTKIKGLKEFFVYRNPANGQKEIGAKTKNGDIHEFQIRGLMMTNEFQELKNYIINENN